jgi:gliding motility-associated-like protein
MTDGPAGGVVNWQNQNSPTATASVNVFGTYTLQLYEQNLTPDCSATDEVTITFYPIPNVLFSYTPILCFGDITTVTYNGNATAAANYSWGFSGGSVSSGSGQGPYQISYPNAGQFQITLSVEENGCNSNDTTVTLISPEELTHVLTLEDDPCFGSCNGSAFIEVDGGTGAYNYSWASGNQLNPNLCAGDYGITVTDQNNCSSSESFTINQSPELLVTNVDFTNVSCFGFTDGSMSLTAQGGIGDLTYTWSQPIGVAGPIVTDIPAGNYFVTVSDENACSVLQAFQITQPNELLINISPDVAICQHDETFIQTTQTGGTAPYSFLWDSGDGFAIGPQNITVSPDTTTLYTVYVTDGNACVSNTESVTVTVSPELIIDSIILNNNRCYHTCDGRAELVFTGGIGPFEYSWGSDNYIYDALCAGVYQITISDAINCAVSETFYISEPDSITYTYDVEPATCNGYDDGHASIFVEGGTLPYTYLWANGDTINTMINGAGTYYVTVEDANHCRIEPAISIGEPSPILVQAGSNSVICISQEANLSAQAAGGNPFYDFAWSGSDGSQYITNNVTVSPDSTTHYTVTVTDSHGCFGNIAHITVNVLPPLDILSVVTSYDTVCPREGAIIYVDAIGGYGGPYMLMLQDGSVVPSPFTVYPEETTMYHITLTDVCGTPAVSDSILINVYPDPPNVFVADRTSACAPATIQFTELSPDLGQTFLWNFGDNGFDVVKNPIHVYRDPGVYNVQLTTRSPFGCFHPRTVYEMITVYDKPFADFYTDPENVSMLDAEIEFLNVSEMAEMSFWFFGDGDSSLLWNPRHQYPNIGDYEIMLIVESAHGCKDTTYRSITVNNEFSFYAPTSFTPNGDGTNDCFRICGNGIDPNEFYLSIYDRWGTKVYETEQFLPNASCKACSDGAWDGTNKGDVSKGDMVLENGVYSWYCEFKDWTGIVFKKQGTVTMVR